MDTSHADASPPPMTAAQLRVTREFLGLTGEALAEHLHVASRTVRHWEAGVYAIPAGIVDELDRLQHRTDRAVDDLVLELLAMPRPAAVVYRTDGDFHATRPGITLPASWHRAVVARAARAVEGTVIDYDRPA